jgi:hypothetical protein
MQHLRVACAYSMCAYASMPVKALMRAYWCPHQCAVAGLRSCCARTYNRKCAYARRHGTAYIDEYTDSRTMRSRERIQAYTKTHIHKHTCIHACMHTCIHAYIITRIQTNTPIQKRIQEYLHTCVNACMHTDIQTYRHTPSCAFTPALVHACMHARIAHAAHMQRSYPRQCTHALARNDTHASIPHASAYTVRAPMDTRRCPR